MDHMGVKDLIGLALGILFLLIRNHTSKVLTEEVKTTVSNKGNETQIKIKDEADCAVKAAQQSINQVKDMIQVLDAKLSERLDVHDMKINAMTFNLHNVVKKVGVEWKEDVTLVVEPKEKK